MQETTDDLRRYLFNECLNLDPLPLEADSSMQSVGLLDIDLITIVLDFIS